MRAVLISAGRGTRLIPLTLSTPKWLVPVGGRTILDWQLDAFHRAGVTDVAIVGGYKAPLIAAHLARLPNGTRPTLVLNPFWAVSSSIGSVWMARGLLDAPFCLLNGDTLVTPGLLSEALRLAGPGVNLVVEHAPAASHDDMRVEIKGDRVLGKGRTRSKDSAHSRSAQHPSGLVRRHYLDHSCPKPGPATSRWFVASAEAMEAEHGVSLPDPQPLGSPG